MRPRVPTAGMFTSNTSRACAFGSSAAQGTVRGSRFYHADMGFTLAFPGAWTIGNTPSKVVAYPAQKDAFLELYTMAVPPNTAPREFLVRNLGGTPLSSAENLQANGLQGYTAIAREVPLPWGNRGPARFAVVYLNNMAYVFRGATHFASAFTATDPLFMSSIKTFRRLKDSEYALAEPTRIELLKATPQTRIETLAQGSPIHPVPGGAAAVAERPLPEQGTGRRPDPQGREVDPS